MFGLFSFLTNGLELTIERSFKVQMVGGRQRLRVLKGGHQKRLKGGEDNAEEVHHHFFIDFDRYTLGRFERQKGSESGKKGAPQDRVAC
jgi:hypothetical protein